MSPLDSFWNGVLSLLTPVITPDWGKLIVLIPWLLVLLVLGFLARIVGAWVSLYRSQPVRGPRIRQRSVRPIVVAHVAVALVGVVVVAAAFIVGSNDPSWNGQNSPLGLVVSLPLLLLGLLIVVAAGGSAARTWDRHGRDDIAPDIIDRVIAVARRHPSGTRRAVAFALGVVLAAAGLLLGTAPGPADQARPVAVLPLLLPGLALAVGAAGTAIAALWRSDPDFEGSEGNSLVATRH